MNDVKTSPRVFRDRREAGAMLAGLLRPLTRLDPVVLALPRGGVPVAFEVARALGTPLDVLVVRKVGAPGNPELGLGAVAEGGISVLDKDLIRSLLVSEEELTYGLAVARDELRVRLARYRPKYPPLPIRGRAVIVVDDGLATGGTAAAAVRAVRARGAASVFLAVPVGAADSVTRLRAVADEVICAQIPEPMRGVGAWYADFRPTSDNEVIRLLDAARATADAPREGPPGEDPPEPVQIPLPGGQTLGADLSVPPGARGLVIFAHGSGSSRHSPRNRYVAGVLQRAGLATLLLDLLTTSEEADRHNVFDISLLAGRLIEATRWATRDPRTARLAVGYFGASTGGGAALVAAAESGDAVGAVVSRGGRPDLAGVWLDRVRAPVLLLVGGADTAVLELNREAAAQITAPCQLVVVPGATHLFEEPGALDDVAAQAASFLVAHLGSSPQTPDDELSGRPPSHTP